MPMPIVLRGHFRPGPDTTAHPQYSPPMDFPDLDLPLAGGGTLARADLTGRPWVVYLTRHPG